MKRHSQTAVLLLGCDVGQTSWSPGRGVSDLAPSGTIREPGGRRSGLHAFKTRASDSQRGVALVVTLVMLSIVTFMTVVFLGISRRERTSVKVTEDQGTARLMADTALARAQAQVLARMLSASNVLNYDFAVSTNFASPRGFDSNLGASLENVGYPDPNGASLNSKDLENDFLQNLANLYYDPRPPVYFSIPLPNGRTSNDFRFYLDFNRNGRFEANGTLPVNDDRGRFFAGSGAGVGGVLSNYFVGDPEWIGVLERPDRPHSATNRFVGRYAFLVLPEGKSLDLNFVHNRVLDPRAGFSNVDGFGRSQGFGSWELNLAGFFRELNTNRWSNVLNPPSYFENGLGVLSGTAAEDARAVLVHRYGNNGNTQQSVRSLYGPRGDFAFRNDGIDGYSDALSNFKSTTLGEPDNTDLPWAGASNTNAFTDIQQLFTLGNSSVLFSNLTRRLSIPASATNQSSYDRYSFYRLLSALGTDSKPALENKTHLNYSNAGFESFTNGAAFSATNFIAWTPVEFFTNAADRILRTEYAFGVHGIPIYPSNYYTAQLHRLLQVAANIYDGSTNRPAIGFPNDLPSVFRPIFERTTTGPSGGTNVAIVGFREVRNAADTVGPWIDMQQNPLLVSSNANVYGIPYVVGVKKGYPNFNEFELRTAVQVARKLELVKRVQNGPVVATNQMLVIGISNLFGVEAWNSYSSNYARPLQLRVTNVYSMVLSNEYGVLLRRDFALGNQVDIPANSWAGHQFRLPLSTNLNLLPNSIYRTLAPGRLLLGTTPQFERFNPSRFPVPRWTMTITNRLNYMLIDRTDNRVVDFVSLKELSTHLDITRELSGNGSTFGGESSVIGSMWLTNRPGIVASDFVATYGIINQMQAALGILPLSQTEWTSFNLQPDSGLDKDKSIDLLRTFYDLTPLRFQGNPAYKSSLQQQVGRSLIYQVPFAPIRKLVQRSSWAANDPLVHYTVEDLRDIRMTNDVRFAVPPNLMPTNSNLGLVNDRYRPWLGNPTKTAEVGDPTRQDSFINTSDSWTFPSQKFANIGLLGLIHRGTPWQTIYFKSGIYTNDWALWAGNPGTHPTNDWRLPDLFTVAPNENAARGLLSVNQTESAAWAAVFSGSLQSNGLHTGYSPGSADLKAVVDGINRSRSNYPSARFPTLGSVLSTPELTMRSPQSLRSFQNGGANNLSDAGYEELPNYFLSLLKADEPRVAVYAFGQSLKPAESSLVKVPGPFFQICTNYQVTGEVVTKTLIRFDGIVGDLRSVVESFNVLPAE